MWIFLCKTYTTIINASIEPKYHEYFDVYQIILIFGINYKIKYFRNIMIYK
ncbi:hypothetical protein CCP4SC76_1000004 [Gammaproteobacteria bacterium]